MKKSRPVPTVYNNEELGWIEEKLGIDDGIVQGILDSHRAVNTRYEELRVNYAEALKQIEESIELLNREDSKEVLTLDQVLDLPGPAGSC